MRIDIYECALPAAAHLRPTCLQVLYPQLSDFDVRYYIHELLIALDFCHSNGIMHRCVPTRSLMLGNDTNDEAWLLCQLLQRIDSCALHPATFAATSSRIT